MSQLIFQKKTARASTSSSFSSASKKNNAPKFIYQQNSIGGMPFRDEVVEDNDRDEEEENDNEINKMHEMFEDDAHDYGKKTYFAPPDDDCVDDAELIKGQFENDSYSEDDDFFLKHTQKQKLKDDDNDDDDDLTDDLFNELDDFSWLNSILNDSNFFF